MKHYTVGLMVSRKCVTFSCTKFHSRLAHLCTYGRSQEAQSHLHQQVQNILNGMKKGDRGSLASAITLVESEHRLKKILAQKMLDEILQCPEFTRGKYKSSYRIGLSGPPGAGKSTFIEVFGKMLTQMGRKVAVLAVDPSSATSGGSLLGDKTRMPELTKDKMAFIRPSPARGHLGGVTRSTNEAIILCEYAGYDIIIVETVGVGQSEYSVTNMVDVFVLLIPPGGGDELQGVKRGIIEKADILAVTKCDGDLKPVADRTKYEYTASLKYMRASNPNWKTKVVSLSAKTKEGLDGLWTEILKYKEANENTFLAKRSHQRVLWTWTHITDGLKDLVMETPDLKILTEKLLKNVENGGMNPGTASDHLMNALKSKLR